MHTDLDQPLLVVGAGGHAKVVLDAARGGGRGAALVLADDDARKHGLLVAGLAIVAPLAAALPGMRAFHVAIGDNAARARISAALGARGLRPVTLVHPRACVSGAAAIAEGAFLAAQCVVAPDAHIEAGCIVNHGAVVDHDCRVAAFAHIAPNATLGGGVRVGRGALIGAGATIAPGLSIGAGCIVGAGAVVLRDLEPGSVHVGVPAHKLK